jgi:ketosteroid isomerase-like protein
MEAAPLASATGSIGGRCGGYVKNRAESGCDMTDLSANKQVCINFLNHLANREFAESLELVSDDIVWWVQGTWEIPTTYHGKAGVKFLLDALDNALASDLTVEFGALTAEDDRVAVEMKSTAAHKSGNTYAMTYHYLFRVRDGLIVAGKEYLDTKHLAESVFG